MPESVWIDGAQPLNEPTQPRRLGVIMPSSNQIAEAFFHHAVPGHVSVLTTRLKLVAGHEAALRAMADEVEGAADLLRDAGAELVLFHCTAVSTFSSILEASIVERVAAASGCPATATSEAIVAALRSVNARRIVMLSPYGDAINRRESEFMAMRGFEVLSCAGRGCETGAEMVEVTPSQWEAMAIDHRDDRADAYLLSCTNARTSEAVTQLERRLGKPVITSNTAALWHSLRKLGMAQNGADYGQLFRLREGEPSNVT